MRSIKYFWIIVLAAISFTTKAQETNWVAPADKAKITAPMKFTPEMEKAGEQVFIKNCKSCHGDPGKNNVLKLTPPPPDLGAQSTGKQSDGSFYYKITTGKTPMPTFKNILTPKDIWNVIAYIRTFHKGYVQPEPQKTTAFGGELEKLNLTYLADSNLFKVVALSKKKDKDVPAAGVELELFAKRYFGKLKIGENKTTNNQGIAYFEAPKELPGDKEGFISFSVNPADMVKYGDVSANGKFKAGVPTDKPALNAKRAIWNVVQKAPWWITFAYPLAVLGVLGTIVYILLLLKKVNFLGKESTEN